MRSEHVATNVTCNQNCTFCDRRGVSEDPAFVRAAAVRARVDEALRNGARELVLTGGEPALRRDLEAIVSYAKAAGAARVVLETNGTLIDDARAKALAAAGLDVARVHLMSPGPASDAVTRDEGGQARTVAGIHGLLAAGVAIEVRAAVVRSTAAWLPELPAYLVTTFGARRVRALLLGIATTAADERELLSPEEAGRVLSRVAEAARSVSLEVRVDSTDPLPPCVVPDRARHAHLFAMTRGGVSRPRYRRIEACAGCEVEDRCPGFAEAALARFGAPAIKRIEDDRLRRRLSLVGGVEQQIARELVTPNRRKQGDGPEFEERIIRVNFHCNQACRFCFVSTHLPAAQEETIRAAIIEAGRAGARVTLSGGEPTLNPALAEYVRLAREHSAHPVELQTNATRIDDDLCARLEQAGLSDVFVSLHGMTAEVSDAVTEAPGTFEKTVAGLDALARSNLSVTLNFVLCRRNYESFPAFVDWAHARWPRAVLNVSFVASSTDVVPRARDLVPSYAEVMPVLAEAFRRAAALEIRLEGLEAMCGVPLCLVPTDLARFVDIVTVPPGFDAGEFVRAEACRDCALQQKCFGIRRGYVELYGLGELRRVAL